ncbi:hypothetical protein LTR62_006777 [Meristemomyces frigidus]|uniref:Xylanolytic transcriptional activator regulatory domain-containing protein n=1 Tax=Meristemomyces frigidus TaxID=1508187 RepID=A0AAN7TN24_9PEZI|nr:hypothetical protein LTR62_006777 [Meristemomyces frigidus]
MSREDVWRLEEQERALREQGQPPSPTSGSGAYVGEASGINILDTVFSSPQWSEPKARALKQLFNRPRTKEPDVAMALLPTHEAASYLATTFLQESQWQKPFLLGKEVLALLDRVYAFGKHEMVTSQDRFRLFMICAIAIVPLRRRGILDLHPYSFFLTACTLAGDIPLVESLDGLMNLLLIARFSVYYNTGISIWELGRTCMRSCISLELHLPPLQSLQPLDEQHCRRIFWECYVLDRYSSTTLGRPFSIADSDIHVKLPVPFADDEVERQPLDTLHRLSKTPDPNIEPGPMDVFILCINLRRITSRIYDTFFTGNQSVKLDAWSMTATADIHVKFHALLQDLETWRQSAPVFLQPECLYQRPQWYDFMLEKERNFLVRGVIDTLPQQDGAPPGQLIDLCLDSASKVIRLYADMYIAKHINCTRTYFQVLFTAGLSLVYFTSIKKMPGVDSPARLYEDTLRDCSIVLRNLSDIMPDAEPFARIFDIVCEHTLPTRFTGPDSETRNDSSVNGTAQVQQTGAAAGYYHSMITPISNSRNHLQQSEHNGNTDESSIWPSDWSFPEPLMTDMETFASQFACGDFSADIMDDFGGDWSAMNTWNGMGTI